LIERDTEKRARLMSALDDINGRFGRFTAVRPAGFKRGWKMSALDQKISSALDL
jgi:DNA polymerase V